MLSEYDKQVIKSNYQNGKNPEDIAEELELNEVEVIDYCSKLLEN